MVKGMLGSLYGETNVDLVRGGAPGGDEHCVTSVDRDAS